MSPIYEDHRSKRYEPSAIDLENKNCSQVLLIELIGTGKNVLEVGTSTGYVSRILKERGNTVTGIEIDPEAGEIAGRHCDSMIIGDIEKLDLDAYLAPSSFDIIMFGDVLEHLVSPEDALRKVKKYLRPSGYLAVSLPNVCHGDIILNLLMGNFEYTSMGLLDATHLRFFGLRNIIDLFTRCGYSVTDVRTTVLAVGNTEQRVDPGAVPEDLADFVKSLPNANVYQYVFKASPSSAPEAVEAAPVPDLDDLFHEAIEESIQAETKPLLEENQSLQRLIAERDARVASLDEQVRQQATQLVQLSNELASVKQSIMWRLLMKFHNGFVERVLPQKTRRRKLYDLGLVGSRILVHEGPRSLWVGGKKRLQNKFQLKSVNVKKPILRIPLEVNDESVLLPLDNPLVGRFISPTNKLSAIEVLTWTPGKCNTDLRLSVGKGSLEGPVIREVVLKRKMIVNKGYSRWEFKPIPDSQGKVYYFQVESTGSPSAAVWYNSTYPHEKLQLFRDGKEINGRIGFQCFTKEVIRDPYQLWILQNEPSEIQLEQMREECANLPYQPKISIVTPVWNTDEKYLRNMIDSVQRQVYDNWELCIVDGGSEGGHVKAVLNEYFEMDSRIKVKFLSTNLGISDNTNEALSLVTGEYIGFLDHDDELAQNALYEVVKLLNGQQDLEIIYSDNDKIDENRFRKDPFFKPDWSLPFLLSTNYPFHLLICKTSLVKKIGGLRREYDGAQDYDFILRMIQHTKPERIGHIQKVLYHWRVTKSSSASGRSAKPYAYEAGRQALHSYLVRRGIEAEVFELEPGSYRVKCALQCQPQVGVVLISQNSESKDYTKFIRSLVAFSTYSIKRIYVPKSPKEKCKGLCIVDYLESFTKLYELLQGDTLEYLIFVDFDELSHNPVSFRKDWIEALLEQYVLFGSGVVGTGSPMFGNVVHSIYRPCGPIFCVASSIFGDYLQSNNASHNFDTLQIALADVSDTMGYVNVFTPFCMGNLATCKKILRYYSGMDTRPTLTKNMRFYLKSIINEDNN
ncbi:glycosyltransferase [uncultured Methanoculleus sp.]|jgi:glycosyltransferase involved in cell wall biosynthesis/SAM-dependent methyltransferase|uniref:Glycosyltransferase n=1 Tax=Methanoculleus palmolei TaxID=72612 RepID=A0ABD8ABM5_9EURY|nr:glycosyltransferase [Methanoculleus palmolei]